MIEAIIGFLICLFWMPKAWSDYQNAKFLNIGAKPALWAFRFLSFCLLLTAVIMIYQTYKYWS